MFNQIVKGSNQLPHIIETLKESQYPLVLYGAGEVARLAHNVLLEKNIEINEVFIDDIYWSPNKKFYDYTIKKLGMLFEKYDKFNIIIGLNENCKIIHERFKSNQKIMNIFMIDNLYGCGMIDYNYVTDNGIDFVSLYNQLSDTTSKDTLTAFINTRLSNNPMYICDVTVGDQYFPNVIKFTEYEVFVDCGSFDGDTILDFVKYTNKSYTRIYALEPDNINFERLTTCIEKNRIKDVVLLKKGVWNRHDILKFSEQSSMMSAINDSGTISIEVDTIDNIVQGDKVTFIKMDVEGAELEALQGAWETIIKDKPKLAISVYHKHDDLIKISQYIKSLVPEYKLYLRAHKFISVDVVLYATL